MSDTTAKITLYITNASYPHSQDHFASMEIDLYIYRELTQGLENPSPDSDPLTAMLCTDPVTIKRVKELRQNYANLISNAITDMLVEAFEKNDTICGHEKEDR